VKRFIAVIAIFLFWLTPALAASDDTAQTTVAKAMPDSGEGDPFLWLEDKDGARAMAWVREQNSKSLPVLKADSHYARMYSDALAILESKDRIPMPSFLGGDVYNFWQDQTHVRGIWRRTSLASYAAKKPQWTTVLDLDALAKREHANWVWRGAECEPVAQRRCLVALSDGGEDAVTVREFDLATRHFVAGGFTLPRGKQSVTWLDPNTVLASREWKPGQLTTSGYAYVVKRLRRGQPLSKAVEVFRGSRTDVEVDVVHLRDGEGRTATLIERGTTFFTVQDYLLTPRGLRRLNVPLKSDVSGLVAGRMLFTLRGDWNVDGKTFKSGSLVDLNLRDLSNPQHLHPALVYDPGPRAELEDVEVTKHAVLLMTYENVRAHPYVYTPAGNGWTRRRLDLPELASVDVAAANSRTDDFFLTARSFLKPTTLYAGNAVSHRLSEIKALPAQFDASNDVVEQYQATSNDGTKIPYFIVHPRNMRLDGTNPTVLNAYGGFQVSMTPFYSGTIGKLWLERGGVFVLANIRGGGEFGPAWHEAALKTHRQRAFDDFYAVGKDLIARKITSPRRLGIIGGSNGGLLMGVEFTQHPEMWDAVCIQVPLLDMLRYEKIEAGASWVGEYGSVSNPKERAFLESISPYQNLKAGIAYPEPLIWTTTKDDRVGPQHARKFAAKLAAMDVPYLFYEVTEGGHGSGANLREEAQTDALEWTYFAMKLME
jgi:prolyl oligopeptidase